jgi:hypothetical protein
MKVRILKSAIKEGIEFINKNKINLDHVPYIKNDKKQIMFIYMVLSRNNIFLYYNIPNELIIIICYNYLNILKTESITLIDRNNICPCPRPNCLKEWFSWFSKLHLNEDADIYHCNVKKDNEDGCHSIGWRDKNGGYCDECERYCCDWCLDIQSADSEHDDDEYYFCKECI